MRKRAKKKPSEATNEELDLNLTPMIDVVFNLIIFFMIVTDMSQKELELLTLPAAISAVEDKGQDKKRIIVNINRKGEVIIKRNPYTLDELAKFLYQEASIMRDPENRNFCDRPILIRCDSLATFNSVQDVMRQCAEKGVGIWKVQLAASVGVADDAQ